MINVSESERAQFKKLQAKIKAEQREKKKLKEYVKTHKEEVIAWLELPDELQEIADLYGISKDDLKKHITSTSQIDYYKNFKDKKFH